MENMKAVVVKIHCMELNSSDWKHIIVLFCTLNGSNMYDSALMWRADGERWHEINYNISRGRVPLDFAPRFSGTLWSFCVMRFSGFEKLCVQCGRIVCVRKVCDFHLYSINNENACSAFKTTYWHHCWWNNSFFRRSVCLCIQSNWTRCGATSAGSPMPCSTPAINSLSVGCLLPG